MPARPVAALFGFNNRRKRHVLQLPPLSLSIRSPTNYYKQRRTRATRFRWRHRRWDDRRQHQPSDNKTNNQTCKQTRSNNDNRAAQETNNNSSQAPDNDNDRRDLLPARRSTLQPEKISRSARAIFKGHGNQPVDGVVALSHRLDLQRSRGLQLRSRSAPARRRAAAQQRGRTV